MGVMTQLAVGSSEGNLIIRFKHFSYEQQIILTSFKHPTSVIHQPLEHDWHVFYTNPTETIQGPALPPTLQ